MRALVWCEWTDQEESARVDPETGQRFCSACGSVNHAPADTAEEPQPTPAECNRPGCYWTVPGRTHPH